MEVRFVSATSCGRCMGVGGTLLSAINKRCNVTRVLYTLVYKLVDGSKFAIECIQACRSGMNTYLIRIKL